MRRTLIIVSVVVVLAGLGAVAYFLLAPKNPGLVVEPTPTLPVAGENELPDGGEGPIGVVPEETPPVGTAVARLSKISAGPVVPGVGVVSANASTTPEGSEVEIFFIERQSGNVFSYVRPSGKLTRTSNKTVPGIQDASWLSDASVAIVRYLSGENFETVNTYALTRDGSPGSFFAQNLTDIDTASSSVLTVASGVNGSIGTVQSANGSGATQVFTTPLSQIRASFGGSGRYLVFTKPSTKEDGYAFVVDSKGAFARVAGPRRGLAALASPTGAWLLVSYVEGSSLKTELVNTATREATALPVGTIADKCVWTKDGSAVYCGVPVALQNASYPDDWYQGAVQFNDRIWKIDIAARFAQLTLDFSAETKTSLDAVALALDPSGRVLVFMNKNDGSLWSYEL